MKSIIYSLLLCLTFNSATVAAGQKYAFLVGISGYDEKQLKQLPYARADIVEFREVLLQSGFKSENVVMLVDDLAALPKGGLAGRYLPEHKKIREELRILLPALEPEDELVIGLAGHGVQFKDDNDLYFCPLDADLSDKATLISLNWLYKQLEFNTATKEGCRARAKLLIVDACRKDPESRIRRNSNGPELASLTKPQLAEPPAGVVALFSCAEGQEALEHDPLKHGVFFYHVLEGLKGKADGDMDQQVTLDEMIAFTKARTTSYVRKELRAPQTPRQKGYFDGTWILRSLEDQTQITNSIGMKFKFIPAGEFQMGSTADEVGRFDDESPAHKVRITKPFYMGVTEVTQGQWFAVMKTKPWTGQDHVNEGNDYPATYVSWEDAVEYSRKLSALEGKTYRLPTEAEWEYGCRGGTATSYSFGVNSSLLKNYGWFDENASNVDEKYAHIVGTKQANPFGLYDMHGNVLEWCSDWKRDYSASTVTDPAGPTTGSYRVYRGGSWIRSAGRCRSAFRSFSVPSYRISILGFRLALSSSVQ